MRVVLKVVLLAAFVVSTWSESHCQAGSPVTVGAVVSAAQRVSVERIDHSAWDTLLQKYVDGRGFVDYSAWKASATDQQALDEPLNDADDNCRKYSSRAC